MISFALAVYSVKALSSQLYLISILASFRYFDSLYLSINSLHIYFTAQNSIYNGNFLNCMDINSNSLYSWALFYIYSEIKIPSIVSFAFESNIVAIFYTRRNRHLLWNFFCLYSTSSACITWICYFLSLPITRVACCTNRHHALSKCHMSTSFTRAAFFRFSAWFRFRAFTCSTYTFFMIINCL